MARSTYIYVVLLRKHPGTDVPVAAFTVKHELMSWLEREAAAQPGSPFPYLAIFRVRDGLHHDSTWLGTAGQVLNSAKSQPVVDPEV